MISKSNLWTIRESWNYFMMRMICCVNKLSIWPISKQMENPLKTVAQSHQRDLKTFANSTNQNRVSNSTFCKLLLCYWLFCCFFAIKPVLFKTFEFLPFRKNVCPCMTWPRGLGAWLEIGWFEFNSLLIHQLDLF